MRKGDLLLEKARLMVSLLPSRVLSATERQRRIVD